MEEKQPPSDVTIPTNPLGPGGNSKNRVEERLRKAAGGDLETLTYGTLSIKVRPPSGGKFYRAMRIAGRTAHVVPITEAMMCVAVINGEPQPQLNTEAQVEAMCDRLTRDGVEAVMTWYNKKIIPEFVEIQEEFPDLSPDSEEFQKLLNERREANLKN